MPGFRSPEPPDPSKTPLGIEYQIVKGLMRLKIAKKSPNPGFRYNLAYFNGFRRRHEFDLDLNLRNIQRSGVRIPCSVKRITQIILL